MTKHVRHEQIIPTTRRLHAK